MVRCHSLQLSCTSGDKCQRLDGQHGEDRGGGKFITSCKSSHPFPPFPFPFPFFPLSLSPLSLPLFCLPSLPPSLPPYQDWMSSNPPECDVKGKYYTPVGINLFQIVDQNVNTLPQQPLTFVTLSNTATTIITFQQNTIATIATPTELWVVLYTILYYRLLCTWSDAMCICICT